MVLAGLTVVTVLSSAGRILAAAKHAVTPAMDQVRWGQVGRGQSDQPVGVFGGGGTAAVRESLAEGGAAPGPGAPSTAPTRAAPRRQNSRDVDLHSGEAGHPSGAPGAHLSSVVPVPFVQRGHGPGGGQRAGDGDAQPRDSTDPIPQVAGGVQHHVWLGGSSSASLPLVILRLQSCGVVVVTAVSCRLAVSGVPAH